MYHIKMAFTLIQIGSNLWVNPMQVQGVAAGTLENCPTIVMTANHTVCSDWTLEQVQKALASAMVAKALEGK